jgi:beta-xylosidase
MTMPFVNALHRCSASSRLFRIILIAALVNAAPSPAQNILSQNRGERVWVPDNGDGTYTNPVIHADYSDPDVIRVGDEFYMTSSSFSHFPGLPILHSRDLVNWRIIGHALPSHPSSDFALPQRGNGIWAPAIRYHNGEFRIYVGDPDRGIFMTSAKDPAGPWGPLMLLRKVTGWIDPCPFWDDDGNAYLVHAYANSRVGVKSILVLNRMNREGTEILDDGIVVFVGHRNHPTIEGPKLYKRNGYYYIFAPAGGVKPGWQTVLRSRDIFGPYEDRIVLEQGSTRINGPHQGAWVDTPEGENWFVHFQDRYAYGRIVHLQPMRWENDWPVIGVDLDKNGIGEPVGTYRKPTLRMNEVQTPGTKQPDIHRAAVKHAVHEPQTNDEFDAAALGLQWQWEANPCGEWYSLDARKGSLRLFAQPQESGSRNLWRTPSLILQKLPAPAFTVTTAISLTARRAGERAGLIMLGLDYAFIALEKTAGGFAVSQVLCQKADKGTEETTVSSVAVMSTDAAVSPDAIRSPDAAVPPDGVRSPGTERSPDAAVPPDAVRSGDILLRITVRPAHPSDVIPTVLCTFQYSADGTTFRSIGKEFTVREGHWVGAKVGLFCLARGDELDDSRAVARSSPGGLPLRGYADVGWFRFGRIGQGR